MESAPDLKDKHVLAAAIKTNANLIVTNNLKDFPEDYLSGFGLKAKNADDFLADLSLEFETEKSNSKHEESVEQLYY